MTTELDMGFSGRDELGALLERVLPDGWRSAVTRGDVGDYLDRVDKPAIVSALGEQGWVSPNWPREEGGRGLSKEEGTAAHAYLDELEVPRIPRGAGLQLAAPTILRWGRQEVRRRFLPRIATGEEQWCQLFSEPGAGSDLASIACTARRDGDEWVVNGQKVWTTAAQYASFGMLVARTDPSVPKHQGLTYFALDMRAPGVEVRSLVNIAGQHEFNEVFLSDVRVPDAHRVSDVGDGWNAALTTLGAERHALSGGRRKRRAKDEILGGKTFDQVLELARRLGVEHDPLVRGRLMVEYTKGRILKLTIQRGRENQARGRPAGPESSLTKLAKASSNQSLQVLALDLLGAHATAWSAAGIDGLDPGDFVVQMLRTRANSIEGGTSEIQRNIIGERVLGLPREPDPYRGKAWNEVPRS